MNLKEIKEIINLMNENELTEIELEREGTKIKIKKGSVEVIETSRRAPIEYREIPQVAASAGETTKVANSNLKEIKSPMVGTFYRAPSPDTHDHARLRGGRTT